MVWLVAYLVKKHNLTVNDVIRHYDITGKQCPLFYVPTKYQSETLANERWNGFKQLVKAQIIDNFVVENNVDTSFMVRVYNPPLNIRKDAGTNNPIVDVIKNNGVYTIVETKNIGTVTWGKLKSGVG